MSVGRELTDEWKRLELGAELNVDTSDIEATRTDHTEIRMASFYMLHCWYNQQGYKADAYMQLCEALKKVKLEALIEKCLGNK